MKFLCLSALVLLTLTSCHLMDALRWATTGDHPPAAQAAADVPGALAGNPLAIIDLVKFAAGFLATATVGVAAGHKVATSRHQKTIEALRTALAELQKESDDDAATPSPVSQPGPAAQPAAGAAEAPGSAGGKGGLTQATGGAS